MGMLHSTHVPHPVHSPEPKPGDGAAAMGGSFHINEFHLVKVITHRCDYRAT